MIYLKSIRLKSFRDIERLLYIKKQNNEDKKHQ